MAHNGNGTVKRSKFCPYGDPDYIPIRYQDTMTDGELSALKELLDRITDIVSPYPIEGLDKEAPERDARSPGWRSSYNRVGKMVTWHYQCVE